ncbi:AAA family ATPase [Micromonospora sp. NPDC048930]|uniref:AAA family ATPase n=1 Tax=Micromonospora sp. NPDC048930 TaxID=3364261 RepID=UPI003714C96D
MPVTTTVGSREAVTRWPVPEERRTVSVLFVDIVGSTGLVERLDPEEVRALQRGYFSTVAGVLRRWNGVVEKYIGDAVMALFGAHGSDGFDAYRAVRAGLEIQEALDRRAPAGTRLRIRVGVATGEVVVDLAATHDGGHGAASGAVITTAARLQQYAPPGGVVACAATGRAVAGLIELRPLAALSVAGKARPLDVWWVTGPGRAGSARHHQGPLVGRRRELATAGDEIARAVRERRPRWVSLVGPPGSGRSRLLHELTRTVSTVDGAPVRWCVAHCPPYPRGELAPLADMVRAFAGARDADPAPTVRRRLAAALDTLLEPARRAAAAHALADFLAAPQDAGAAARGAEVWREVLLDLAAHRPLVVGVDDLDRAAPPLNRFLHRLFAAATERSLPLAVVATHGPGWADLLPGAAGRRRRVPLGPLGTVDTGRLLRHLLGRAGQPAALARDLLPLAGGNPAVAQAYVRALDPDAGPAGPVPEAVRRMVDARLDRLDGPQRAVLMAGAACGTDVDSGTVERLLDWTVGRAEPVLRDLVEAGVLRRTGRDRYAVAEPTVARVARHRLPRTLRAEFARRARTRPAPTCPAPHPAGTSGAHPARASHPARPGGAIGIAPPAGAAAAPRPGGGIGIVRPAGVAAATSPAGGIGAAADVSRAGQPGGVIGIVRPAGGAAAARPARVSGAAQPAGVSGAASPAAGFGAADRAGVGRTGRPVGGVDTTRPADGAAHPTASAAGSPGRPSRCRPAGADPAGRVDRSGRHLTVRDPDRGQPAPDRAAQAAGPGGTGSVRHLRTLAAPPGPAVAPGAAGTPAVGGPARGIRRPALVPSTVAPAPGSRLDRAREAGRPALAAA